MLTSAPAGTFGEMEPRDEVNEEEIREQSTEDNGDTLILEDAEMSELPVSIQERLYGNDLLRKLSLKNNLLTSLPPIFDSLGSLYYVNISNNRLDALPSTLCDCLPLEILDVSNNRIRTLPPSMARLKNLKVLSLSGNSIKYLSPVIADLPNLVHLEVDNNPLVLPPPSMLSGDDDSWIVTLQEYLNSMRQELLAAEARDIEQIGQTAQVQPVQVQPVQASPIQQPMLVQANQPPQPTPLKQMVSIQSIPNQQTPQAVQSVVSSSQSKQLFPGSLPTGSAPVTPIASTPSHPSVPPSKLVHNLPMRKNSLPVGGEEPRMLREDVASREAATGRESRSVLERSRSASESGVSLRQAKRMGFVMQKNATGNSYVASLHARGLSHDASMITPSASTTSNLTSGLNPAASQIPAPVNGGAASHASAPTTPQILDTAPLFTPSGISMPSSVESPGYSSPMSSPPRAPTSGMESLKEQQQQRLLMSKLDPLKEEDDDDEQYNTDGVAQDRGQSDHSGSGTGSNSGSGTHEESPTAKPETPLIHKRAKEKVDVALQALVDGGDAIFTGALLLAFPQMAELWRVTTLRIKELMDGRAKSAAAAFVSVVELMDTASQVDFLAAVTSFVPRRQLRLFVADILTVLADFQSSYVDLTSPEEEVMPEILQAVDEQLFVQLEEATKAAQSVLSLVNTAIARSAHASAVKNGKSGEVVDGTPILAIRTRELSETCIPAVASTRKVRSLLDPPTTATRDRRRFWDDVNMFLKSIIAMLGAIKSAMPDMPLLADTTVGAAVANLARNTKEIPPLLEQSSFKASLHSHNPSGNVSTPTMAPTPLTASLGAAAASVLSPGMPVGPSPFIPSEQVN